MNRNRLAVRAKKSVSGLFISGDGPASPPKETAKSSPHEKENDTPDLEDFGSYVSYTGPHCSDVKESPPHKDSPSRRQKLMGSLRRISSLRSIRSSPSRTRKHEECPPPKSPRTPTQQIRPSLTLNFDESPPGQPMFEVPNPRSSTSSSLVVHHSSPMTVPPSAIQGAPLSTSVHPSILPPGTIPDSPTPLQMALEKGTTLPHLTFEDIHPDMALPPSAKASQEHPGHSNIVLNDDREGQADYTHIMYDREAAREAGNLALKEFLASINGKPETSTEAPTSHNYSRNYHRADGKRVQRLVALGSDEVPPMEGVEHIVYEDDSRFVAERAIASIANGRSVADSQAELERRPSTWGRHDGLYDGTGYGYESRSITSLASTEEARSNSLVAATPTQPMPASSVARASSDHDTVEEVIRAYERYYGTSGINDKDSLSGSEKDMEDVVVRTREDIDLSNRMMNANLGA